MRTTTEEWYGLDFCIFSKSRLKFKLHDSRMRSQGLEGVSDHVRSALTYGNRDSIKGLKKVLFFLHFAMWGHGVCALQRGRNSVPSWKMTMAFLSIKPTRVLTLYFSASRTVRNTSLCLLVVQVVMFVIVAKIWASIHWLQRATPLWCRIHHRVGNAPLLFTSIVILKSRVNKNFCFLKCLL